MSIRYCRSPVGVVLTGKTRSPSAITNWTLSASPLWPERSAARERCTRSQEIAVIEVLVIMPLL
jgi:hypothetical protein